MTHEILASPRVREAYALLDPHNRRSADWHRGVEKLEEEKATWSVVSCLCHPREGVQISALQSLKRLGDRRAVPFVLLYAEYMAVDEEGSEEATVHGLVLESTAGTLSALTGIDVKVKRQDVGALKAGIEKWRRWLVDQHVLLHW